MFICSPSLQILGRDGAAQMVSMQCAITVTKKNAFAILQESIQKKDLNSGREVHLFLQRQGLDCEAYWADNLIRMFTSCNRLVEAYQVFENVKKPSVYTWSAIISAHAKLCEDEKAIGLFHEMLQQGIKPDKVTYLSTLKACRNLGSSLWTKFVHDFIVKSNFESDHVLSNALADIYANCGNLEEAHHVFNSMPVKDVVSWSALITGYTTQGKPADALELCERIQSEGMLLDRVILLAALKACGNIYDHKKATMIHHQVLRERQESDLFIGSTLVDTYVKCGCLQEARKIFDALQNKNPVSWSTLIVGHAEQGDFGHTMELFQKFPEYGTKMDRVAFLSILKACSYIKAARYGMLIHAQLIENGFLPEKSLENTLVDMYARCGSLDDAQSIFDNLSNRDVVSWAAMISGYGACGLESFALSLFNEMQQNLVKPNSVIFLPVLNACVRLGNLIHGMLIHEQIIRHNFELDLAIANKLVDMYAKHGRIEEAEKVFRALKHRDIIAWGTMISGCAEHGYGPFALQLYGEMWEECAMADRVIFLCVIKACGSTGSVVHGRKIHYQILSSLFTNDTEIGNTLVDMYAKVGTIKEAQRTFNQLHVKDNVSWAAMISGYAQHGDYKVAAKYVSDMQQQGFTPNSDVFTNLLLACNHSGVVNEGQRYFEIMVNEYGIKPAIEHYNCIIDLLGRVGHLKEAISLSTTMHVSSDTIVWTSLLASCRTYQNVDLGRQCFSEVLKRDPDDGSAYVLMSNIFADAGMWTEVEKLEKLHNTIRYSKQVLGNLD